MEPSKIHKYNFREFKKLKELFEEIYYGRMRIPSIKREQDIFEQKLEKLKKYAPRNETNIDNKNDILKNAKNLYEGRRMIIVAFENKLFPLASGNYYDECRVSDSEKSSGSEESEESSGSKDSEESSKEKKYHLPILEEQSKKNF